MIKRRLKDIGFPSVWRGWLLTADSNGNGSVDSFCRPPEDGVFAPRRSLIRG